MAADDLNAARIAILRAASAAFNRRDVEARQVGHHDTRGVTVARTVVHDDLAEAARALQSAA